jgi:hypothetical protein
MQIFNSGFFWFVEGILFVVMILGFRAWALGRGVSLGFLRWALVLVWLLLAGFTIAFVGTSFGEGEPTAAIRGGLLFGLISVIGGVGLWRFLSRGAGSGGGEVAQES